MHGSARLVLVKILMIGCAATGAVAQEPPSVTAPAQPMGSTPASTPQLPAAGEFKTAEALLDALETADRDLRSLTAKVKWDRSYAIQGDRHVRLGRLSYVVLPAAGTGRPPQRKFAIHFDQLWVGPTQRPEDRTYIFDGEWVMEKDGIERFFQKRQVVPPGETFDPLRIGQGPMTLPIGQKKAEILERYDVELLPAEAGLDAPEGATSDERAEAEAAKADVQGSWQLRLVPKPKFADEEDFSEIRLWYKRGRNGELLPRMARTESPDGNVSTVLLINTEVQLDGRPENPAAWVDPAAIDTTPPEGWNGSIQPWRGRGRAGAEAAPR